MDPRTARSVYVARRRIGLTIQINSTRSQDDAEDLAQDTCLWLLENIDAVAGFVGQRVGRPTAVVLKAGA